MEAQFYNPEKPSIFFDDQGKEELDKALHKIAAYRAQNTQARQFYKSEQEYLKHKKEMNDFEIVELLKVRDYAPELVDQFISHLDN